MSLTVRHSYMNPANNRTVECEGMDEARTELARIHSQDDHGSCSDLLQDGVVIATRMWDEPEITWF